jgi:hypothetical protein
VGAEYTTHAETGVWAVKNDGAFTVANEKSGKMHPYTANARKPS